MSNHKVGDLIMTARGDFRLLGFIKKAQTDHKYNRTTYKIEWLYDGWQPISDYNEEMIDEFKEVLKRYVKS